MLGPNFDILRKQKFRVDDTDPKRDYVKVILIESSLADLLRWSCKISHVIYDYVSGCICVKSDIHPIHQSKFMCSLVTFLSTIRLPM